MTPRGRRAFLVSGLAGLATACGRTPRSQADRGPAARVVSQTITSDEILWALGEHVRARVIAVSSLVDDVRYSTMPDTWPADVPRTPTSSEALLALRPDLAPKHVERGKQLAREGFYDGLAFHRVIDGFMAQTGDPRGDGTGGSKYENLPAEFTQTPFERGVIGAARTADPNSANSQFFIVFDSAPHLNGQYMVWGQVIDGLEHVDKIKRGEPGSGRVADPDKIVRMYVLADRQ